MGTQGVGTFGINSKFASGSLVFYEKAVGRTATGDVFTVGTDAVKIGGTGNDIDFQYYGTGSLSAIIDCGAATFTLVGIATTTNGLITANGGITMGDAKNIAVNTTTGTKIGTATSQKIGFWNSTPVIQQAHIADPTGGATVDAEARTAIDSINALCATLGITAAA